MLSNQELIKELGDDPVKMAEAYQQINPYPSVVKDHDKFLLTGWFENAITAGQKKMEERIVPHLEDYLKLMKLCGNHVVANNLELVLNKLKK